MSRRRRILFFAEAVTLAHVTRPLVLARSLHTDSFDVHFACAPGHEFVTNGESLTHWPIHTIPTGQFLRSLASGSRLYDLPTLRRYSAEDQALIAELRPDLVVGDFRLSLAVSAPLSRVPYVALTNAHWSPYASGDYPLPELPMVRYLGLGLSRVLFRLARPLAFIHHARPLNKLRRLNGLPPLGDLRHTYTFGDYTLYADTPALIPTHDLPDNHHYIGPILWSPEIEKPHWWHSIPQDRPCVYVTLGSSGRVELLPILLRALGEVPANILVATAGRAELGTLPGNVFAAEYLPGEKAANRSRLVICNGGSGTVYQALAVGTPVLGIASNLDQHLTMRYVGAAGAGILLRAGQAREDALRQMVGRMLADSSYRKGAELIAQDFARLRTCERFSELVRKWLTSGI